MNKDVIVLMSTYNGEKYILEQIRSIMDQDYLGKITIQIRDDGSKDQTVELVQHITTNENRKIEILSESNVGPQKSFIKLIDSARDAAYYFFADQDDVWEKDKISRAVSMMEAEQQKCCMYCGNYDLTDQNLNLILKNVVKRDEKTFHFLHTVLHNSYPGCVMGFDKELLTVLKNLKLNSCMMHDSVALATAIAVGNVVYDDTAVIKHRIHDANVIGYGSKKIKLLTWIKEKVLLCISKENYDVSEFADRLLATMWDEIHKECMRDIILLRDFKKSYKKTIELFRHKDSFDGLNRCTFSIWCKILLRLF